MANEPLQKRNRTTEPESWDCAACTFKNPIESYRCSICLTRKGTSTRKTKVTNDIISQQQLIQQTINENQRKKERIKNVCDTASNSSTRSDIPRIPTLENIDRSHTTQIEVFANGFSVTITEFKPKTPKVRKLEASELSPSSSESSRPHRFRNGRSNLSSSSEDFFENIHPQNSKSPQSFTSKSRHKRIDSSSSLDDESIDIPLKATTRLKINESSSIERTIKKRGRPKKVPPTFHPIANHDSDSHSTQNAYTPQSASSPIDGERDGHLITPKPSFISESIGLEPMKLFKPSEDNIISTINAFDISKNTSSMTDSTGASALEISSLVTAS